MRSRRKRISFSLCVLLLAITVICTGLRWLNPPMRSGVVTIELPTAPPNDLSQNQADDYRKTHLTLLQSPFIITMALRDANVRECRLINDVAGRGENPVMWAQSRLRVSTPNDPSEGHATLVLTSSEGTSEELSVVAQAIARAFRNEVSKKD